MQLMDLLAQKKAAIVDSWLRRVAETYPPETTRFLRKQKDKFANPVGSTFAESMELLFDELLRGDDPEKIRSSVDNIIRIRAVQDFAPSQAAGIFFFLKAVIRNELANKATDREIAPELCRLESRIDQLTLVAFDVYVQCRQKIWEVKYNDLMKRPFVLTEGGMCPSYLLRKGVRQGKGTDTNNSHN